MKPGCRSSPRQLTFERTHRRRRSRQSFADADAIAEATFLFAATPASPTSRALSSPTGIAGEQRLTVYQGTQAPHMMQNLFAKHLGLAEQQVRVITKDVGGSFGIKVHAYADEMATAALAKLLRRPVKFVADRLESFVTDIHARDHRVKARIGVKRDGTITAFAIDDLTGIGPYSVYPRTSGIEANQVVNLIGGPVRLPELSRPRPRRFPEQERHVPIPRRRPPDRDRGHRGFGRSRRRRRSASTRPRSGGAISSPTTPIRRPAPRASGSRSSSHHASLDKILRMMDYAGAARRAGARCARAASTAASAWPRSSR